MKNVFRFLMMLVVTASFAQQKDYHRNIDYFTNVGNNNALGKVLVIDSDGKLQWRDASTIGSSGGGTWGSITGTITSQSDLIAYINAQITAQKARFGVALEDQETYTDRSFTLNGKNMTWSKIRAFSLVPNTTTGFNWSFGDMFFSTENTYGDPAYDGLDFFALGDNYDPSIQNTVINVRLDVDGTPTTLPFTLNPTLTSLQNQNMYTRADVPGTYVYLEGATLVKPIPVKVKLGLPVDETEGFVGWENIVSQNEDGELYIRKPFTPNIDKVLSMGPIAHTTLNWQGASSDDPQTNVGNTGYSTYYAPGGSTDGRYSNWYYDGLHFNSHWAAATKWDVTLVPNRSQGNATPIEVKLPATEGYIPTTSQVVTKLVHRTYTVTAATLADSGSDLFDIIVPTTWYLGDIFAKTCTIVYNGTAPANWSIFTPGSAAVKMTIFNNSSYQMTFTRTGVTTFNKQNSSYTSITIGPYESITLTADDTANRWYVDGELASAQQVFTKGSTVTIAEKFMLTSNEGFEFNHSTGAHLLKLDTDGFTYNLQKLARARTSTITTTKTAAELNTAFPDAEEGDVVMAPDGDSNIYVKTKNVGQWQIITTDTLNPE